ncbi:MAG: YihY family inner membrane protein [Betaproteobacteria bacterium]|nr:YihY family inner membrane protein [Betaproteobacteria bacterium]
MIATTFAYVDSQDGLLWRALDHIGLLDRTLAVERDSQTTRDRSQKYFGSWSSSFYFQSSQLASMRLLMLPFRVFGRFVDERCAQTAAALSFSTLLSLVPMIAIAVAIIARLPFAQDLSKAMEHFLLSHLLPERAGAIIVRYVGEFTRKTEHLTLIGGLALAATALLQMLTIEHTFNAIWKVRENRPLLRRIAMHVLALLLGPLLFGGSLAVTTYVASASFGLVDDPFWAKADLLKAVTFTFMAAIFALLYWAVPNRRVVPWHAACGGVLAALGFALMQRLFGLYVAKLPTYTVIYGAFAAIPIFLIWLHLSWSVILIGALMVAELPARTPARSSVRR